MFANASLSCYNIDSMQVENSVFYRTNGFKLGDVAQSMVIHDSLGYIAVNNSARIDVININTNHWVASIKPLTSPRYIYIQDDTLGYITDLYTPYITLFNPATFEICGSIPTNGHFTEQMVAWNHYLFVNCWSYDHFVLVIDTRVNQVIDSIDVGFQPQSMVLDKFNKLWVLTDGGYKGNPFGYEQPRLERIDATTRQIEQTWRFNLDDNPSELQINGTRDTISYINTSIWQMAVTGQDGPLKKIEAGQKLFYALGIDSATSDIYVADAIDHLQPGIVYRYSSGGQPADTFKVGIAPGMFCFE